MKAIARETRPRAKPRRAAATGKGRPRAVSKLLGLVEHSLDKDKAEDVVVIDLAGKSSIADYMVIASGRSQRQVGAMAEHIGERLKAHGVRRVSIEGARWGDWVLIDGGDVVVHLFRPEVRRHYNLEKMWGMSLPEPHGEAAMA